MSTVASTEVIRQIRRKMSAAVKRAETMKGLPNDISRAKGRADGLQESIWVLEEGDQDFSDYVAFTRRNVEGMRGIPSDIAYAEGLLEGLDQVAEVLKQ